ncbi:mitogen-activated kinase kinase kinase YODA-like [Olea europaea subsp. europaea]|uniref:Mitogen-activated kinase kinase kinase YODA-like n=1 Tax=Olea europaea subsp. europaea TaxID=158383 RepID=A0A8S0S812_OLEEU|nr:mitogen-activated kinase kinase kinase YODA-like [Olea europaea subsp. europaea]
MYLSPEAVVDHVQKAPSDIWALGCIVLEMLTGKLPWEGDEKLNADDILRKIGEGNSVPKIPNEISQEAKDFLKGCFVRKTMYRWTAEMLLNHPFVEVLDDGDEIEELEDDESLNEIEPMLLVTECEDEFVCELSPDEWGFMSEEDSLVYLSGEDAENVDDEIVSNFSKGRLKMEELKGGMSSSTDAGFDQSIQISSENAQKYPISFTIPAGI